MNKIGLIGRGFVGNAIYENLKSHYDFVIYDTDPERTTCFSVKEVCEQTSLIYVVLPTPMKKTGECDLSIVENTIKEISENYRDNVVILKSTIPPGTTEILQNKYPNIRLVFSPEFLTQRIAVEDFSNCNRMIFGGDKRDTSFCVTTMKKAFPGRIYVETDSKTAEMVKYFANTLFALKVSFSNEIKQICDKIGISYDEVKITMMLDDRISPSHMEVPGPDGSYGFGGVCFPKDINALIYFAEKVGVKPTILKAAWEKNLEVRKDRDWESLKGRAVSGD